MRVIGSFGLLKESEEFVLGSGRDDVSQLQYGLSLKGDYDAGVVRGFEINAYRTDASSDTDRVETGDLTGIQMMTRLQPAIGTNIRLGAGYEQVTWAGGTKDEGFTAQVLGFHQLSDTVALSFEAKSAETETVYGLGLGYDLSTADGQNSHLSVTLTHIEGRHGISDDTRVALNWTMGFGAGSGGAAPSASSMGSMARADLLAEVMTRPAFLPERVIARTAPQNVEVCDYNARVYYINFRGGAIVEMRLDELTDENGEILGGDLISLGNTITDYDIYVNSSFYQNYGVGYFNVEWISNAGIQLIDMEFENRLQITQVANGDEIKIVLNTSENKTICAASTIQDI
jgi:hypothetical protein